VIDSCKCGKCLNDMSPIWGKDDKLTAWHCTECNLDGRAVGREYQITKDIWLTANPAIS